MAMVRSNPIRSWVFETANDPGGGGGFKSSPPHDLIRSFIQPSPHDISCMCILLGVSRMFQLEFKKKFAILTILQ